MGAHRAERLTTAESVEVVEYRSSARCGSDVDLGPSSATLTYLMRAGSARLDVHVELDWHHREHLLSLAFPLDVRADTATCGVQFGSVRRPTHASTSWDAAKFEVCAHRYVDVAEPAFGVAVLDDGRYGHALFDGVRCASLARAAAIRIRAGPGPPRRDREPVPARTRPGRRRRRGRAARPAGAPVRGWHGRHRAEPVVEVTGRGVEIDAVKLADDGSGDVIAALHEAATAPGSPWRPTGGSSRQPVQPARGTRCRVEVSDGIVATTLRPFELLTLRLTRERRRQVVLGDLVALAGARSVGSAQVVEGDGGVRRDPVAIACSSNRRGWSGSARLPQGCGRDGCRRGTSSLRVPAAGRSSSPRRP